MNHAPPSRESLLARGAGVRGDLGREDVRKTPHFGSGMARAAAPTEAALLVVALAAAIGVVDSDLSFRACSGALLLILASLQLYIAGRIHRNRNNLHLELFQPRALSLFVAAGVVVTLASFLFALPEYDTSCALRQPIILTCITFMGNILVARAWRIGGIISPTAAFASSGSKKKLNQIGMARLKIMNGLTKISRWGGCCGKRRSASDAGLRRTITHADSMRVTVAMLSPQVALQIVNLAVPDVRSESVETYEGVYQCQSSTGPWLLIVGIVLAAIPFALALIVNTKNQGIPDKLREFDEIGKSVGSALFILIVTLPTAALVAEQVPKAYAYLLGSTVLSLVLPLFYQITWKRTHVAIRAKRGNTSTSFNLAIAPQDDSGDDYVKLEAAENATLMGKMFATMGRTENALEVDRDALNLFKVKDEFSWEEGFTRSEINSLGPKTLTVVISTLIASAKRWQNLYLSHPENEEAKRRASRACLDALQIFEQAPSKSSLKDESVVFSGYSFLNHLIKTTIYRPPGNQAQREKSEKELALNFLRETKFQQYHYCRALAMQADTTKRHGDFDEAIIVIERMRSVYIPSLHSKLILEEYVSDACADILAASVYWLYHLGRKAEALRLCDYIIQFVLPEIGASELVSLMNILLPITRVYKYQGEVTARRGLELYRTHIAEPMVQQGSKAEPSVAGLTPSVMIILKSYSSEGNSYDGMKDDIEYLLNGEDKIPSWMDEASVRYLDWTGSSVVAEACLCLAKKVSCNDKQTMESLIKEGLRCIEVAWKVMQYEDPNACLLAFSSHSGIHSELKSLSVPL